jgi:hypothetical protein
LAARFEAEVPAAGEALRQRIEDGADSWHCEAAPGVVAPLHEAFDFDSDCIRRPGLETDGRHVGLGVLFRDRLCLRAEARINLQAHRVLLVRTARAARCWGCYQSDVDRIWKYASACIGFGEAVSLVA